MNVEESGFLQSARLRLAIAVVVVGAAITPAPPPAAASLYAVTDAGAVFESSNDGVAWTAKGLIPDPGIVSLSPGLTVGRLLALGATGTVYESTDAAVSWNALGNAGASDCVSLAIARGGDLIALTRSGDVVRSTNNGVHWSTTSTVGSSDCVAIVLGGVAGAIDTLLAVTSSGDVAISPAGAAWTIVGSTGDTPIVDLLWIRGALYALTDAGELATSSDNGASWVAISTISQVGMRELAHAGGKFKAISKEGEVYESATGSSWSSSWIGTTNQVFTVAFAPGIPEFMTGVEVPAPPTALSLRVWPTPFTSEVRLALSLVGGELESSAHTEITVYDTSGRAVTRLYSGPRSGVPSDLTWRATGVGAGVYFARVRSGELAQAERLVLVH